MAITVTDIIYAFVHFWQEREGEGQEEATNGHLSLDVGLQLDRHRPCTNYYREQPGPNLPP